MENKIILNVGFIEADFDKKKAPEQKERGQFTNDLQGSKEISSVSDELWAMKVRGGLQD